VIRYAASPAAFVDLAADLSWLARLKLDEFALDQHLPLPSIRIRLASVRPRL